MIFGDYLYIIVNGTVDVLKGADQKVAELTKGKYFGEMALLNQRTRSATVKAQTPVDLLALRKNDFGLLIANFQELRQTIEATEAERSK